MHTAFSAVLLNKFYMCKERKEAKNYQTILIQIDQRCVADTAEICNNNWSDFWHSNNRTNNGKNCALLGLGQI